jgi:hypothetical protein
MAMSNKYPFQMEWDAYTDMDLVVIARDDLSSLDREDMISLIVELARRVEELQEYLIF